ncbi:glycosyltransferase [Aliiroseovarius sp. YM-037]|uniref:glycosyltransferase n=1 Tax=Aliiroseovarius sp. YM-037 TaxID=3341728 RepID=UPI003A800C52
MTLAQHIVVVNVFFAPHSYGGATIVAEQVANELNRRHGITITAISAISRADLAPYQVVKVERNGIVNYLINLPTGRRYVEIYDNPIVADTVQNLLEFLSPNLVHVHCAQDLGANIIGAARQMGFPVVLSVHDFWWLCERQFMIRPNGKYCGQDPVDLRSCRGCVDNMRQATTRAAFLRTQAAQANLITYPSAFAMDLANRSGFPAERSVTWTNGVRLPRPDFFAAQAARRAADPRPVFGFLGGPSQIKGWPLIRSAFRHLNRSNFAGLLVDGSLDQSWWQDRDIGGMRGDWQFHPRFPQAEIDAFYAKIDILLFMSQWKETFGLTIREALARGIKVIQTDSGGTTEYPGADRSQMIPIGVGPDALVAKLNDTLDASDTHPTPIDVTSYAEQADAFLGLVEPILRTRAA